MNRTVLQIPISLSLRQRAEVEAEALGFSSLQEVVRVLLSRLAKKELRVVVEDSGFVLSKKAMERYAQMDKDFERGENIFEAKNANDLLKKLNEN
ncbi:hypothetical protein KJ909_00970 [Patescibacteria group bacterium]|nr:hypothetical protein [Patescibacteria group bacterium]